MPTTRNPHYAHGKAGRSIHLPLAGVRDCFARQMALVGFLSLLLGFQSQSVSAATFSLTNFADAFVTTGPSGNLVANNYGAAGALAISAVGSPQGQFQSVLKFDFASAKANYDSIYGSGQWSPQSISLQLTTTAPNNSIFNSNILGQFSISLMQDSSWTEGNGTPATPSPTGINFSSVSNFVNVGDVTLGTFTFGGGNSGTFTYTLNLTPDLSADMLAGGIISLRLYADDPNVSYLFDSRSFGTASSRPQLLINVPEPGTAALTVTGVALMILGKRFRSHRTRA
jgi:hypothetical protein